jgi:hypothetical protein
MDPAFTYSSDIAFTPSVKAVQTRKGSRRSHGCMEERGAWAAPDHARSRTSSRRRTIFLATANAEGQPYIPHRGGPPGFLRVLDDKTIGFVDFAGNRQIITQAILPTIPRRTSS